jgi:hypothetical protein
VEAIRRHALEAHGIDCSPELALDVVRRAEEAPSGELTFNGGSRGRTDEHS